MPRPTTEIWKYFKRRHEGKYIRGDCKFCNKSFIANPKRQEQHLLSCLKAPVKVKQQFLDVTKKSSEVIHFTQNKRPLELEEQASVSNLTDQSSSISRSSISRNISTLDNFLDHMTNDEENNLHKLLARSIYATASPLSLVENKYFKNFLHNLRPSYTLPSRYKVSTTLLENEYQLMKHVVSKKIHEAESIVILTDGWTDVNGIPLINIILYTPSPIFYKTIDSKTSSHTGEYMTKILSDCIEEIGEEKVEGVVTDNARNMVCAWNLLQQKYPRLVSYGCVAHGLNLLLKDLFTIQTLSKYFAIVKDVIKFYKNKHIPKQILKQIQMAEINKEIALVTYVETRWGSAVATLESLLKNKDYLQKTLFHKSIKTLIEPRLRKYILDDEDFWQKILNIVELTKPLSDIITKLEGDSPVLSKVHPYLKTLELHFNSEKLNFLTHSEKEKVQKMYQDRKKFVHHPIQLAAHLLDPKQKGITLDEEETDEALNFISQFAETRNLDPGKILSEYAQYKEKKESWKNQNIWNAVDATEASLWWKAFFQNKLITKVAVKILNFPATAGSCERNWKTFSIIKTKRRNRLTIERTHKLVYIKFNLNLLDDIENVEPSFDLVLQNENNNINIPDDCNMEPGHSEPEEDYSEESDGDFEMTDETKENEDAADDFYEQDVDRDINIEESDQGAPEDILDISDEYNGNDNEKTEGNSQEKILYVPKFFVLNKITKSQ